MITIIIFSPRKKEEKKEEEEEKGIYKKGYEKERVCQSVDRNTEFVLLLHKNPITPLAPRLEILHEIRGFLIMLL